MPRLTTISIDNIRPRPQRYAVADSGCRGLYLNVQPSGRKSWSVRYRVDGRTCNLTLDGFLPLALARKAATEALADVAQGKDPAGAKAAAKAEAQAPPIGPRDTVARLAAQFIAQYAKRRTRMNSWRQTEGIFRTIIIPAWGPRNVRNIVRRDVRDLLDHVASDRPVMANRVRAVLSRWFGWLAERDIITASPLIGVRAPTKEQPRERVLNDDELVRLWRAAEVIGGTAGACVKLLMFTAARRSEIAKLKWSEVDGDLLNLPVERMKGKAAHLVPLSTQAAAIIANMPGIVSGAPRTGDYVWGKAAVGHWHRIKPELDAHMGDAPKWVVHDIRRSVASGMARLGIAVPVIERLLAHKSGTFKGVTGVYQRHSFLPEMTVAVQRWADHLEQLVGGKPAKVVKLHRR
jgi:integrase